jgi:hypothetical protein
MKRHHFEVGDIVRDREGALGRVVYLYQMPEISRRTHRRPCSRMNSCR